MHKGVYGTVRGPASWRETLIEYLIDDLGYIRCPNEPCAFILRDVAPLPAQGKVSLGQNPFEQCEWLVPRAEVVAINEFQTMELFLARGGRLIVLTDDILDTGDEDFRKAMQMLQKRLRFGKYKTLRLKGGGIFNGRRAEQNLEYSVRCTCPTTFETG